MTRMFCLALFVAVTACGGVRGGRVPQPARALTFLLDSLLRDPRLQNAQLGVLVVDPVRGDTLLSHNAGKLFMPASNQKVLTGSVALARLGPAFRFSTAVFADGAIDNGVVRGNLRIAGTGDPSLSDRMAGDAMRPLRAMADSLASRGITRIAGALVPGADAFPDAAWGFGWSWDDFDYPYSAGVDELYFNEGFTQVVVRGGAVAGAPVTAHTRPNERYPAVRVSATTVARDTTATGRPRITVAHDSADAAAIVVQGTVAAGDTQTVEITWHDQQRAYLQALHTALGDRGIAVDQGVGQRLAASADLHAMEPAGTLLFSMVSPPLPQILAAFEKPSQNQIGEILLKTLGRSATGVGTADSGARVVRDQLLAWGAAADGFVVRDGSGLSRYNVVSPETIVKVLNAMRQGPHFEAFFTSLPIAGVDGSIGDRMRGTRAAGNVHAKTGTLNMVRSLSGYVTTADGRVLLFSLLANHFTAPTRVIDELHEAIVVRLAGLSGGAR